MPMSVSTIRKSKSWKEGALSFVGINPAPKYLTEPPIENKIFDMHNLYSATKSKGEKEADEMKKQIKDLYLSGKGDDAQKLAKDAVDNGILKSTQTHWLKSHLHSKESPAVYFFSVPQNKGGIPDDVKVQLYNEMTDKEKKEFDPHHKVKVMADKKEAVKQKKEKPFSIR
jgi:hypothetical protein